MRMGKLTTRLQMALADAQSIAVGRDHQYVEPLHLMQALLDQDGHGVRPLLEKADINAARLRSDIGKALERLPRVEGTAGEVLISNELGRLLNVADKLSQRRGDEKVQDAEAEEQRGALERYTIDLTERAESAESGKLDPVIGRDDEIRRIVQVLQRRTKNNPALIGEPGVGKTAVVEGLEPRGQEPGQWRFRGQALRRIDRALNLQRDLDINLAGVELVLDLLDEIDALRSRVRTLGGKL
jgi:ATP-dependent Clp protease ATP-binding subunit ClpB